MNGFDVAVSYIAEEHVDDSDSVMVKGNYAKQYNSGHLKVGVAIANIGKGKGLDEHEATAIVVSYDVGNYSVGGGWQDESDIGGVSGVDRDHLYIGASAKVGAQGTAKLQWATSDGDGANSDATQIAIGYDYAWDKHTTLFANYAKMDNDSGVMFSVNGKGHGDKVVPLAGDDPSALSLGIVYKFDVSLTK